MGSEEGRRKAGREGGVEDNQRRKTVSVGASLVVSSLRICLAIYRIPVQSQVQEDPRKKFFKTQRYNV